MDVYKRESGAIRAHSEPLVNWNRVEKIFFDMDGTVLDLHFDNRFWLEEMPRAYAKKLGRDTDFERVKKELDERVNKTTGRIEWYCLDYWSEQLDMDIVALKHTMADEIRPLPHALECLSYFSQLQEQCLSSTEQQGSAALAQNLEMISSSCPELWLTTNAHRATLDLKLQRVPIGRYFSRIISSHDYGYPKEDQRFWQQMQAEYPFDPQTVLFIDDTRPVLAAAREFGIGQLLNVLKPDSRQPVRLPGDFKSISSLRELHQDHRRSRGAF